MRHRLEYSDTYSIYMCIVCGTAFTQDALIAEMDAHGCVGPEADEGFGAIGDNGLRLMSIEMYTSLGTYTPGEMLDAPSPEGRFYSWFRDPAMNNGTRLIDSWLDEGSHDET